LLETWAAAYGLSVQAFVAEIVLRRVGPRRAGRDDGPSHRTSGTNSSSRSRLPVEVREMALRAFRDSAAAMNAIGELARKN
jgi:hypothetical protein